jgi:hypothetical protein
MPPQLPLKNQKKLETYRKQKAAAVKARQTRVNNWLLNEQLYNGQTNSTLLTRSNLHVPKVFENVQSAASRLGTLPDVTWDVKPEKDENASDLMKSLWEDDIHDSEFEDQFQSSKVEAGIYGRAVYKLIPSNKGCTFELVDTMAFLINPTARSTKNMLYGGQQFIYKTIEEIEADAETFDYDKDEIKILKDKQTANETDPNAGQEKSLKDLRLSYLGYSNVAELGSKMVELTEWYSMMSKDDEGKGKKEMYVMTVANDTYILRCVPIKEVGLSRSPFVSWATFPRGVVFWTPGIADVTRDPNLAMDVAMNQMIDNNTYRNFGMKFVSSQSGLKQSSIVPRPLGITAINVPINSTLKDHVMDFTPPEIGSANQTLQTINQIADNAVGLSALPIAHKGKLSVTQQSAQSAAIESKTNMMKQNIIKAFQELGQLYADCIMENLTEPRSTKAGSASPMTLEGVTKKNFGGIKLTSEAVSPDVSTENKAIKQKARSEFYQLVKDDPKVPGQEFLRRSVAKEFGYDAFEVEKLFTQEPQQAQQQPQPSAPAAPGAAPAPEGMPTANNTPVLQANGQATAANVPPAIR